MVSNLTSSPELLLPSLSELTREEALDRVDAMTDEDLEHLMNEIESSPRVPEVFATPEMLARIEARINHTDEARTRLDALKEKIETGKQGVTEKAEKAFLEKLQEKGGGWAVVASIGITVLSWFGFGKAKELKKSLDEKGYLRTAIEGAKEHPIFAAFIAAMGIKAGTEAYQYMSDNREAIEKRVEEIAGERGLDAITVVDQMAGNAKDMLATGADKTLRGTVKFLAWALRGEYNEETGVVTLPHSTLRPPIIVAYQAGVRRRGGSFLTRGLMNRFVVEDKLNTILRQTNVVATETKANSFHKKKLAKRALELMNSNKALAGSGTPEALELERILDGLSDDLKLSKKDMIAEMQFKPQEAEKRVKTLQDEMLRLQKAEMGDFKAIRDNVNTILSNAETDLANGRFKGSAESLKTKAVNDAQSLISNHNKNLADQKLALSDQLVDAFNHLSDADNMRHHASGQLDSSPRGGLTGGLEQTTRTIEQAGYNLTKLPGGKWATRLVVGYSFMPLLMEGASALRPGKEGEQAQEALKWDATEAALGFVPGVGEVMDFRTAFMGTDLNGREIDTWGRVVAGSMGTLGLASIGLGFFTGGATIVGFKALRGAVTVGKAARTINRANKGIEVAGATSKSLKAIKAGKKNQEKLEQMLKLTNAQKAARKARGVVQNAQRGMQLYTYGHLGVTMATGAVELYNSTENVAEAVHQKAVEGIDAAQAYIHTQAS